jgi:ABC-type sugar transport system ATPase subunit
MRHSFSSALPESRDAAAEQAVALRRVTKVYRSGCVVTALNQVTLGFEAGTFTAVMGPSGSGKSTLLQCAAGLDRPSSGEVWLGGQELGDLSETKLTVLRRNRIGFVFQSFNLLPSLTAELNVALPLRLAGRRPPGRRSGGYSARSAWPTGPATGHPSCPAGSSSGSPSPVRWSPGRRWCSRTSQPACWTRPAAMRSWACCVVWSTGRDRP